MEERTHLWEEVAAAAVAALAAGLVTRELERRNWFEPESERRTRAWTSRIISFIAVQVAIRAATRGTRLLTRL